MEYDADDTNQSGNWFDRIKQSPRTVSALIIILIVAAAIYAFSGNKQNDEQPLAPEETQTAEETPAPSGEMAAEETKTPQATTEVKATPLTKVSKSDLKTTAEKLPESKKTDTAYVEVAQKGDGLTHLARRAATRYLSENEVGYEVTNEQRIYIEDYVRKHMAKGHVSIGSSHEISFDLIKDAVEKAGQLNEKQLRNLTKYTHALS